VLGGVIIIAAQLNDEGDIAVQLSPPVSLAIGTQDGTRTTRRQADLARRGAGHGIKTPLFDVATMQLRVYNNTSIRRADRPPPPRTPHDRDRFVPDDA
jgi:hypothetical protein